MKKRKTYEISVINKTYSKSYSDQTKFYTSDTALELIFQIKEIEYDFDSAEIILLNVDDRSLVTRPVSKSAEGFIYELEDDIIEHYGAWNGQLKFTKGSEFYVSSPVGFRIHNDLTNDRPPKMNEVNTWKNLRTIVDSLIDDIRSELESLATLELEIENAESARQSAELVRVENENQRNLTSVDEFIKLQNAIGGRNYLLKSGNPNVLNLTSNNGSKYPLVKGEENGISWLCHTPTDGSIGFLISNYFSQGFGSESNYGTTFSNDLKGCTGNVTYSVDVKAAESITLQLSPIGEKVTLIPNEWTRLSVSVAFVGESRPRAFLADEKDNTNIPIGTKLYWKNYKIEKGTQPTPYAKSPEDYTVVSKDDYYSHIKLMSDHRDKQLVELKTAITALGGA